MDKLTPRIETALEIIETQIELIDKKLEKVQPLINEKNKLMAARRALLAERGTTSGSGHPRTQLTMEEVVNYMRGQEGPVAPQDISTALSVPGATVRSHLNRHKGTRYDMADGGGWVLIGDDGTNLEEDEVEEDE